MLWIRSILPRLLIVASGANAFDMSVFNPELPVLEDPIMAVQRLLELRLAPPDMSMLGRIDQESVKFLNHFGGTPSPLFGASLTPENGKAIIILEGITPEVGEILSTVQQMNNLKIIN